jgi:hypothetical protein
LLLAAGMAQEVCFLALKSYGARRSGTFRSQCHRPLSRGVQDVDEELIIDECMTILFAGHDTTGICSACVPWKRRMAPRFFLFLTSASIQCLHGPLKKWMLQNRLDALLVF